MNTPLPYLAYSSPPGFDASPGSFEAMSVWYFGSQSFVKYKPRSCTQPFQSSARTLFGTLSSGWSGLSSVTGASSTVTRSFVTVNGYGPGDLSSSGCGEVLLYCTTSVPPFLTYSISFGCTRRSGLRVL